MPVTHFMDIEQVRRIMKFASIFFVLCKQMKTPTTSTKTGTLAIKKITASIKKKLSLILTKITVY